MKKPGYSIFQIAGSKGFLVFLPRNLFINIGTLQYMCFTPLYGEV